MILVTGGAGYIGSHCVLALLNKGYKVVVFDNLSTGHMETIDKLREYGEVGFIKGDLTEFNDISNVFEKFKNIRAVIHFAASSQVGESMSNPAKYYRNNVYGTTNLLDAMIQHKVLKIVFSSTAATYGEPAYTPIDENHPQNPINTYGRTKLMIENIMDDYDRAYNVKSVRLRYFNVAGADSKARIGEWHEPETHLIPNILKSVFNDEHNFKMYGSDYDTRDGTCIRDYINVEELADAHLLALEYLFNGGKTNFFNLGTNEGNTVMEVFKTCEEVTQKVIPVEVMQRRPGDPAILIADNTKAKQVLKWSPQKNIFETVDSAFKWEQKLYRMLNTKC